MRDLTNGDRLKWRVESIGERVIAGEGTAASCDSRYMEAGKSSAEACQTLATEASHDGHAAAAAAANSRPRATEVGRPSQPGVD